MIRIQWKLQLDLIELQAIRLQQIFTHAMTAELLFHVQNWVMIILLESMWDQNKVSIVFEQRWKKL